MQIGEVMPRYSKDETAEATERLRELFPPGSTAYTVLKHVSRSGMYRVIDVYAVKCDENAAGEGLPLRMSYSAAIVTDSRYDDRWEGVGIGGAGMDMGFAIVYNLSHALYPDGFGCIGERCPSNDHSNGDRDYTVNVGRGIHANHWHQSGGYAVGQRWL